MRSTGRRAVELSVTPIVMVAALLSAGAPARLAAQCAYRNLVELWKNADAALQPRVAAARAALTRLVGH